MDVRDRMQEYLNYKGITAYRLEKDLGKTKGYWGKTKNPTAEFITLFVEKYNDVSEAWLLTGEGEMLKGGKSNDTVSISGNDIKEGDFSGTLVYDIDATCGTDCRDILFAKDDIIGSINLPGIRKDSVIIRANGDSMEPRVCDGNLVVIRQIYSWDDIFYGQIYMILLDEYRMIKYIRKCQEDEANYIILHSENPAYDDIRLNKGKIRKLFIVENILAVRAQL